MHEDAPGRCPSSLVLRVHDADAAAPAVHIHQQVVELPLPRRILIHVRADAAHARRAAGDELHLLACTHRI